MTCGLRSLGCTSMSARATLMSPHSTSYAPVAVKRRGVSFERVEELHLGGEVLAAVGHVDRRHRDDRRGRTVTMRLS